MMRNILLLCKDARTYCIVRSLGFFFFFFYSKPRVFTTHSEMFRIYILVLLYVSSIFYSLLHLSVMAIMRVNPN